MCVCVCVESFPSTHTTLVIRQAGIFQVQRHCELITLLITDKIVTLPSGLNTNIKAVNPLKYLTVINCMIVHFLQIKPYNKDIYDHICRPESLLLTSPLAEHNGAACALRQSVKNPVNAHFKRGETH